MVPDCPSGQRIYCVGDIHGQVALLRKLHQQILLDAETAPGLKIVVYLGDYVDRGLESKAVVDELLGHPLPGFETIYLRGNHEQVLLDFVQNEPDTQQSMGTLKSWLAFGGQATLVSYGVSVTKIPTSHNDFQAIYTQFKTHLPENHLCFFQQTRSHYCCGSYYFVHAGIDPAIKLEAQPLYSQLWIREPFISSSRCFEKIIVHGHTVTDQPVILPNRIGIDTGAYASGILTCLVLERAQQRIIQAIAS